MVIPDERLAQDVVRNFLQVLRCISIGNDLLARPENVDTWINEPSEIAKVGLWRKSEFACRDLDF